MPETVSSSATGEMVQLLTEKLREYACILRIEHREGKPEEELRKEKETGIIKYSYIMQEIIRMIETGAKNRA